jgi:hypothetical protein
MLMTSVTMWFVSAVGCLTEDITNLQGRVFRDAKVVREEPDGVTVNHSGGVAKLFFTELPDSMRSQYRYDPEKAVAYRSAEGSRRQEMALRPVEPEVVTSSYQRQQEMERRAAIARASVPKVPDGMLATLKILRVLDENSAIVVAKWPEEVTKTIEWREEVPDGLKGPGLTQRMKSVTRQKRVTVTEERRSAAICVVGFVTRNLDWPDEVRVPLYRAGTFQEPSRFGFVHPILDRYATTAALANSLKAGNG